MEMVLPGLVGLWIDRRLGTKAIFLMLGVALGFSSGLLHLIRLGQPSRSGRKQKTDTRQTGNSPKE